MLTFCSNVYYYGEHNGMPSIKAIKEKISCPMPVIELLPGYIQPSAPYRLRYPGFGGNHYVLRTDRTKNSNNDNKSSEPENCAGGCEF